MLTVLAIFGGVIISVLFIIPFMYGFLTAIRRPHLRIYHEDE